MTPRVRRAMRRHKARTGSSTVVVGRRDMLVAHLAGEGWMISDKSADALIGMLARGAGLSEEQIVLCQGVERFTTVRRRDG